MNKMWSPWRSQYIQSFKDKKEDEKCIFCKALDQQIDDNESLLIFKDELTLTLLNLYPYNNGHLMVVPKRHLSDFNDLTKEEHSEIMKNIDLCIKALKKTMKPHGFNVGANVGKAAGAGIDQHLHFHIVPRWNGDTNFMPVVGEVKVISQDLLDTKKSLISAIKSEVGKI